MLSKRPYSWTASFTMDIPTLWTGARCARASRAIGCIFCIVRSVLSVPYGQNRD